MDMFDVTIFMVVCVAVAFIALVPLIMRDRKEIELEEQPKPTRPEKLSKDDQDYLYDNPIDPMH